MHRWVLVALLLAIPAGIATLLIWAPFLRIKEVRIEGLTTLSQDAIRQNVEEVLQKKRFFVLPGRNIFFAKYKKIEERLLETYHFAALQVARDGRTLVVSAEERISEIAWISGDRIVLIDLQGLAVSDASDEAKAMISARLARAAEIPVAQGLQPTMPLIENAQNDEVALGATLLDADKVAFILETDAALRARTIDPISYRLDEPNSPWITVTTNGPSLMFDFNVPVAEATAMLDAVQKERENFSSLIYVDLRFGNHVYIKEQ